MTKLTDSQLVVLSAAAAGDDGAAVPPSRMMKAAAMKVGASLVGRKLMREVRAKPGVPVWRKDEDGRWIALVITKAGLKAINAEEAGETGGASVITPPGTILASKAKVASKHAHSIEQTSVENSGDKPQAPSGKNRGAASQAVNATASRVGSKQATIVGMLSGNDGATLDAMIAATGWLPHTTRAMLTGLRKKGFALERVRVEGVTTYRITGQSVQAGA